MKGGVKQWNLKETGGGEDNGLLEGGVGGVGLVKEGALDLEGSLVSESSMVCIGDSAEARGT